MSLSSFAQKTSGGDMPFPIGKVVDFPKDDGKGVWKDELKKKIFRLRPLKGVLDDGTILVQMLGLNKRVVAEGIGSIDENRILTARLTYRAQSNGDKTVDIRIANLCADATFDNSTDFSETCKSTEMWAALSIRSKNQMFKAPEHFIIRKTSDN